VSQPFWVFAGRGRILGQVESCKDTGADIDLLSKLLDYTILEEWPGQRFKRSNRDELIPHRTTEFNVNVLDVAVHMTGHAIAR
jgi:hypothetical protein